MSFEDHEQIFFVAYHRNLLIHIPYAIFMHTTYYKELYANDDEPFKEGPNLRRKSSVCMCVSELCKNANGGSTDLNCLWNLIKDVKKDVITCKELVKKLAKNVLKLWWLFFVKRRIKKIWVVKKSKISPQRKNELNFQRAGTQFSQMPMLVLKLPPPW